MLMRGLPEGPCSADLSDSGSTAVQPYTLTPQALNPQRQTLSLNPYTLTPKVACAGTAPTGSSDASDTAEGLGCRV